MPRPRKTYLIPRRHKGAAVVEIYDQTGKRRTVTLGPWGSHEADRELARLVAERKVSGSPTAAGGITINEMLVGFMNWAGTHYRHDDGTPTNEIRELWDSMDPLRDLYGHSPAGEFGPLALKAVRQRMIERGWCRGVINKRVDRIRRAFKWAASEQLVPVAVVESLRTVVGLRRGRSEARDRDPVRPVEPAAVDATLPYLNRHIRAMVELQRLTGMRPGEVCHMRLSDVDRSGTVWTYRPRQHKTQHHEKDRVVMIGPKGQVVILGFLAGGLVEPESPLFSPQRAREERFAAMREKRKSKVPPSQVNRRVANPARMPALEYTPNSYAQAVQVGAQRAKVEHWHPNKLRHLYASRVRHAHGLEAAQVLLGHSKADVTQIYAQRDEKLAEAVAAMVG